VYVLCCTATSLVCLVTMSSLCHWLDPNNMTASRRRLVSLCQHLSPAPGPVTVTVNAMPSESDLTHNQSASTTALEHNTVPVASSQYSLMPTASNNSVCNDLKTSSSSSSELVPVLLAKHDRVLEMSPEAMKELVDVAMEYIDKFYRTYSMPELPHSLPTDFDQIRKEARAAVEPRAPEQPVSDIRPVLDKLFYAFSRALNTSGAPYLAYVGGGGLFPSAVADLIANVANRYVGVDFAAPLVAQIEGDVIRWLADIVGFPSSTAFGALTPGGSTANLLCTVIARSVSVPEDSWGRAVVYCSDQIHLCVIKSAFTAGIPRKHVRMLPSDRNCRVNLNDPRVTAMIEQDRQNGLWPFMLAVSAGTVHSGAVDDLNAAADFAKQHSLWLHVDGAYGGLFAMTDRGRATLDGIQRADSLALDPHKSMFLPFGTGCALLRNGHTMKATFASNSTSAYLELFTASNGKDNSNRNNNSYSNASSSDSTQFDPMDIPNFSELTFELTRDFRALRLYLPIKIFGLSAFRAYLNEKLALTDWTVEKLKTFAGDGIRVLWKPDLSTICFRFEPKRFTVAVPAEHRSQCQCHACGLGGKSDAATSSSDQILARDNDFDALNRHLLNEINSMGRVFLSGTEIHGKFVIRICIIVYRVHETVLEALFQDLRSALDRLSQQYIITVS
jgi:aromatic-L-amino-acid/L-tryptophan decarboxylase